jgi:bacterioferritin (cytochrome b1)
MSTLDDIIFGIARPANPIGFEEGAAFFLGMRKLAVELNAEEQAPLASPFRLPVDQVVDLMARMVANEFKTQVYYIYYAHMLRGLSHHAIAEEFMEHAEHELEHASYLLRRMSVLSPGGVPIPGYPPPEPMSDPDEIVKTMIVVEQMGLSLWKQLLAAVGEDSMRHSIEDFLRREEEHLDELWLLVQQPVVQSPMPVQAEQAPAPALPPPVAEPKLAAVFAAVRRKAASGQDRLLADLALAVKNDNKNEIARLKGILVPPSSDPKKVAALAYVRAKKANVVVPPPAMDTPEAYMQREQMLNTQAAMAETAHARAIAAQATQAAQQAQSEAQAAQQQTQELQSTLEQQQQAQAQAAQQAQQASQQAAEAEARAAEHSISKMQLGMRMNQLRQELANLVMQDPVSETAATVNDLAAQGQPATPDQQAQAEAQAQQQAQPPMSADAQQQAQEAQNAEQEAAMQAQQAQEAQQQEAAKTSNLKLAMVHRMRQKLAGPADRRMRDFIAQGGGDTLSDALRSVARAPRAAAPHIDPSAADVADAVVDKGVAAAKGHFATLGERIRPHLPGFAAGVGTTVVGGKLLSRGQEQPVPQQLPMGQGWT